MNTTSLPTQGGINILCTGGSFDKIYGHGAGVRNFSFPATSAAEQIVARLGIENVYISYDPARIKDSLDMVEYDRQYIVRWCALQQRAVVIHGTDTMTETAAAIAAANLPAPIIMTGSLQPAAMRDSDAEFNLGGALVAAQIMPPGVYIVMGGCIYAWDNCTKNPQTGHFETIQAGER